MRYREGGNLDTSSVQDRRGGGGFGRAGGGRGLAVGGGGLGLVGLVVVVLLQVLGGGGGGGGGAGLGGLAGLGAGEQADNRALEQAWENIVRGIAAFLLILGTLSPWLLLLLLGWLGWRQLRRWFGGEARLTNSAGTITSDE